MAMDAKQRKTLMIRIGAGIALVLLLAIGGWLIFGPSNAPQQRQSQLGPSDSMLPEDPKAKKEAPQPQQGPEGTAQLGPNPTVQFKQDQANSTEIVTVTAAMGPISIQSANIPTADADVLTIQNIDCPIAPAILETGKSCTASVTWKGGRTVNSVFTVTTVTPGTAGAAVMANAPAAVQPTAPGTAAQPVAPVAAPVAPGTRNVSIPINATWTKPVAVPGPDGQTPPPPPVEGSQATAPQPAVGMSAMQQAREAYLAARRGSAFGVTTAPQSLQAAARSPYTSWDNIGVQGAKSSFPTDMSRVITPDKPLTAVLTYQIDTRATVTAVATVDRDVYGSSGRTVVIPRGTKIIGRIGGGATDRVGIAWNQLIRPDGVRFVFTGESGDAMGRGGVPGRINNRYLQRYGFSLLPTLTAAGLTTALGGQGATVSNNGGTTQTMDARAVAAQILSQPLNQISQDLFSKNSSIPVQITIPAGTRITVWSTGDLRLKPVGEPDDARGTEMAQGGQNQNQGAQRQGNAFNPYAATGSAAGAPAPQAPPQAAQQEDDGGSSLQVGRVDANGNYIAPGGSAPPPPPVSMGATNSMQRVQPQQRAGASTGFTPAANPWK